MALNSGTMSTAGKLENLGVVVTKYEEGVAIQRPYSRAPSAGRGGDGMHVGEGTVTCAVKLSLLGRRRFRARGHRGLS